MTRTPSNQRPQRRNPTIQSLLQEKPISGRSSHKPRDSALHPSAASYLTAMSDLTTREQVGERFSLSPHGNIDDNNLQSLAREYSRQPVSHSYLPGKPRDPFQHEALNRLSAVPSIEDSQYRDYAWGRIVLCAFSNLMQSCRINGRSLASFTCLEIFQFILDALFSLTKVYDGSSCDQDGSGSGMGTSSNHLAQSQASMPAISARRSTKRGRDDPPNRDGKRRRQDPASSITVVREAGKILACPYVVCDPLRYQCTNVLNRIVDVRQHIFRHHLQKPHCPVCGISFEAKDRNNEEDRDNHITDNCCERTTAPINYPGATPDQWAEIRPKQGETVTENRPKQREPVGSSSEAERWFIIWDILFPGRPRPISPYTTLDTERLRWLRAIIGQFWGQGRGWNIVRILLPVTGIPGELYGELHGNFEILMQHFLQFAEEQGGNSSTPTTTGSGTASYHHLATFTSPESHGYQGAIDLGSGIPLRHVDSLPTLQDPPSTPLNSYWIPSGAATIQEMPYYAPRDFIAVMQGERPSVDDTEDNEPERHFPTSGPH